MSEDRPDRCQRPVACLGCVGRAYEAVVLPVRSRRGETPYVMERIDLRSLLTAGRALHERVEDALSSRVFRNVTVDKLISLAGVGAERPVVSCADLVDAFFSYYEFTKIWERRVIAEAVSRAVMEERGGVRGRSRPHRHWAGRPRPPQRALRGMLPVEEIDLSDDAAVLTPEYARTLLAPLTPGQTTTDSGTGPDAGAGPPGAGGRPGVTRVAPPEPPSAVPADRTARVTVHANIGPSGLFNLLRVLMWLRDEHAAVDVQLHLTATSPDGFDKVTLRNRLMEPLEETATSLDVEA